MRSYFCNIGRNKPAFRYFTLLKISVFKEFFSIKLTSAMEMKRHLNLKLEFLFSTFWMKHYLCTLCSCSKLLTLFSKVELRSSFVNRYSSLHQILIDFSSCCKCECLLMKNRLQLSLFWKWIKVVVVSNVFTIRTR